MTEAGLSEEWKPVEGRGALLIFLKGSKGWGRMVCITLFISLLHAVLGHVPPFPAINAAPFAHPMPSFCFLNGKPPPPTHTHTHTHTSQKVAVLLNLAAVLLTLEAYGEAAERCTQVLALDPCSTTALVRRAKARAMRREFTVCV